MKALAKRALTRMCAINDCDELIRRTSGFQVVSFDMFDTLVTRAVQHPEDIFELVGRRCANIRGIEIPENFPAVRRAAEATSRRMAAGREVTLCEIYDRMELSEEVKREIMKVEMQTEVDVSLPNLESVSLWKACLDRGQKIIVASDMYLPESTLRSILAKCGFEGYKELYLSSKLGVTKASGEMFEYIISDLGVAAQCVVHIGDSRVSDFQKPSAYGMKALLVNFERHDNEFVNALRKRRGLDAQAVSKLIDCTCSDEENDFYRFGYSCFGPYLVGFTRWLSDLLEARGIEKVYFLARDGLVLQRAFSILGKHEVQSEYLEVSRRSLRVPILWKQSSYEEFLDLIPPSSIVSVDEIIDTLGLETSDYNELLIELGISGSDRFESRRLQDDNRIRLLYERLREDSDNTSRKQFDLLATYLNSKEVNGKFAVVDIGWSGGMQRYLSTMLNSLGVSHEITGAYTGVVAYADRNTKYMKLDLNGYVFNCLEDGLMQDPRRFYVGFLETLFLEQRGTVMGYEADEEGCVVATRGRYEYEDEDGNIQIEARWVEQLQQGAIDYMQRVSTIDSFRVISLNPEEAYCGIHAAGSQPSSKLLDMFSGFRFYDNGSVRQLAHVDSRIGYFAHPKHLANDLASSRWKTAFAKQLFFGLPLPYDQLFEAAAKATSK